MKLFLVIVFMLSAIVASASVDTLIRAEKPFVDTSGLYSIRYIYDPNDNAAYTPPHSQSIHYPAICVVFKVVDGKKKLVGRVLHMSYVACKDCEDDCTKLIIKNAKEIQK
jgi:hypothetical protein